MPCDVGADGVFFVCCVDTEGLPAGGKVLFVSPEETLTCAWQVGVPDDAALCCGVALDVIIDVAIERFAVDDAAKTGVAWTCENVRFKAGFWCKPHTDNGNARRFC